MDRKNDALGRSFRETRTMEDGTVRTVSAERVYSIAGGYTRPLSDDEVRAEYPRLRDPKTGKLLPSVFPSVQTQGTRKGR